ncbi:hypothetical protein C0Z18_24930 [Trinickia dabaoshanensis]|uniref:Toxin SymE-like domain-containing protein n=1 Tax=Trinickia dabaoshanensis TaxID=564714 RepID=A0A2N7VFW4_9BURK|nr:hypothetical protein C0Z18_24930 [Trinickia dabaoshanensis]
MGDTFDPLAHRNTKVLINGLLGHCWWALKPLGYPGPPLVPWFKPSGRWLEQAGFMPYQRLKIDVQLGKLVITHA